MSALRSEPQDVHPRDPLRSAGSIVISRPRERSTKTSRWPPERSLALRRYSCPGTGPRTLTRSRLASTSRRVVTLIPNATRSFRPASESSSLLDVHSPLETVPRSPDFSGSGGPISTAARTNTIHRFGPLCKGLFQVFFHMPMWKKRLFGGIFRGGPDFPRAPRGRRPPRTPSHRRRGEDRSLRGGDRGALSARGGAILRRSTSIPNWPLIAFATSCDVIAPKSLPCPLPT